MGTSIQDVFRCSVGWQSITLTANTIITNTSRGFAPFCAGNFEFFAKFMDYRLPVGAGHCGVVRVGPRLSGAKPGSEQCLPPRGKQPHERASFAGWRRSLCAAKRPARGSARPPFNGQLPLMLQAGHARPLPRGCHRLPRRGQAPSLRAIVHGCFVGSGLDRSAG